MDYQTRKIGSKSMNFIRRLNTNNVYPSNHDFEICDLLG